MRETVRAIRWPFAVDRGRGELAVENDHARHVEQMMMQVLMAAPGERVNRPDFGCGIKRFVFSPMSEASASLVRIAIVDALDRWLGSVIDVDRVEVEFRQETLAVTIVYALKVTGVRRHLNLEVTS
jgi:uncharacterized protein